MTWQRTLPILATNRCASSWFSLYICTVHVCVFTCSDTSLDQSSHRTKDAAYLRHAQKDQKRIIPVAIISARQLILPIAKSWTVPFDIRSRIAHVQYTNGCDILLGYISSKKLESPSRLPSLTISWVCFISCDHQIRLKNQHIPAIDGSYSSVIY